MKNLFIISILSICVVSCNRQHNTYTVKLQPINEAVYASGELLPQEYFFAISGNTLPIANILVKEGDTVLPGTPLAILGRPEESHKSKLAAEQVSATQSEATSLLAELERQIILAQSKYDQDQKDAIRLKELAGEKAVSLKEAEEAAIKAEESYTRWITLEQQYTTRQHELTGKLMDIQIQQLHLEQSKEQNIIRSSIAGVVLSIFKKNGEIPAMDEPVLLIGTPRAYKLELLVDERDISRVREEQIVWFETDVYSQTPFTARINRIDPVLRRDTRCFKIEATVKSEAIFYPLSTVEANIMIRENQMALTIPRDYLTPENTVWIQLPDKQISEIPVVTGIATDEWIEISSGIEEGNTIIRP